MSLSADPVETFVVSDPRIDFTNQAAYLVKRGAGQVQYRSWQSDNNSASSLSFSTTVPSRDTVVSTKVHVKATVNFDLLCNSQIDDNMIWLRSFPLLNCCTNLRVTIGGNAFSEDIRTYFNALMRYGNNLEEFAYDYSCSPSYMDTYGTTYDTETNIAANAPLQLPAGVVRSQSGNADHAPYGTVIAGGEWSKSQFYNFYNTTNGVAVPPVPANRYRFSVDIDEIIPISPLLFKHKECKGIIGIDKLDINLQLDGTLLRMLESCAFGVNGANDYTITNASVPTITSAEARFIYLTPRENLNLPLTIRYPYSDININRKDGPTFQALQDSTNNRNTQIQTVTFGSIQLQGVPKRIYIFARVRDADLAYYNADGFANIQNISVTLGGLGGILSEASEQALYRMSVKNGLKDTWIDWHGDERSRPMTPNLAPPGPGVPAVLSGLNGNKIGSVCCLNFDDDIPLGLTDAPGTLRQLQFFFTATFKNIQDHRNPADIRLPAGVNMDTFAIVVSEGMVIIKNGSVIKEVNIVSALDMIGSTEIREIPYDVVHDYYGGSFTGGNISSFINKAKSKLASAKKFAQDKVLPGVKKALPYAKKGLELAESVLPMLLAAGYSEDQVYKLLQKGGKMAPKSKLKQRAIKM